MFGAWTTRLLAAAAMVAMCAPAQAQHQHGHGPARTFDGPFVLGELDASFRIDGTVASDLGTHRQAQINFDVAHLHFGIFANPWLSLQGVIKGEPLRELRPGQSETFRGFGIFTAELYLNADFDWVGLFAGKIMPTFGLLQDHHRAWGLFSVDITEDYETLDFIGAGFALRGDFQDAGLGRHELTAQTFFADTTFLHRSIITAPRAGGSTAERASRLDRSDGGPGNTQKLNNFSATLDSTGFDLLPGLGVHLGYRFLHRGRTESRNEHGVSVAFDYTAKMQDVILPGTTTIRPAIEWVRLRNADGQAGSATWWATNIIVSNGSWTWHLTGTLRNLDAPGSPDVHDHLLATSLFYRLHPRWQFGAGYKYQRVRDEGSGKNAHDHVVGIKLLWNHDFAFGLN
jgi:hypothetical protein